MIRCAPCQQAGDLFAILISVIDRNLPPRLAARVLVAGTIASVLGLLALGLQSIWQARQETWDRAESLNRNILLVLERDIARNLASLDLSLLGAAEALSLEGIDQAPQQLRRTALFDRSATAEHLGSITILDQEGNLVETSQTEKKIDVNFFDRDYFQVHRSLRLNTPFVSRSYVSRLRGGGWTVAVSRRMEDAAGQFKGVIAGSIKLDFFTNLFSRLDLGSKGSIVLFHDNGRVVVRSPFREQDVDRNFGGSDTFNAIMANINGSVVQTAQVDGIDRLYSVRRIGDTSLVLTVNTSVDEIYADWRRRAIFQVSILLILSAIVIACGAMLWREMRRRERLEHQLRQTAEDLSVLAMTDSLTGIATKRVLDEGLHREWRRALRARTPLAVLLIDIDHFKSFNDIHGHMAGDRALAAVASIIQTQAFRAGDIVGRFGGEEFQVILPETTAESARVVAERIQSVLLARNIEHRGTPLGILSVSIGIADDLPAQGGNPDDLVERADEALYAAKDAGRNMIHVSGARSPLASTG